MRGSPLRSCLIGALIANLSLLHRTMVRDASAICRKPSVSSPNQAIETGKTEQNACGPNPPNFTGQIQIDVGACIPAASRSQKSYIPGNFLFCHSEVFRRPIGLERINLKTTPAQNRGPEI
jgi:hypothetical protein